MSRFSRRSPALTEICIRRRAIRATPDINNGLRVERLVGGAIHVEATAGILFQKNQTLSAREVGDIVHELSEYIDQSDVTLEYVNRNWL